MTIQTIADELRKIAVEQTPEEKYKIAIENMLTVAKNLGLRVEADGRQERIKEDIDKGIARVHLMSRGNNLSIREGDYIKYLKKLNPFGIATSSLMDSTEWSTGLSRGGMNRTISLKYK